MIADRDKDSIQIVTIITDHLRCPLGDIWFVAAVVERIAFAVHIVINFDDPGEEERRRIINVWREGRDVDRVYGDVLWVGSGPSEDIAEGEKVPDLVWRIANHLSGWVSDMAERAGVPYQHVHDLKSKYIN